MRQSTNNINQTDSIITIANLNWLNNSNLNQTNSDTRKEDITNNPASLKKLMYEEWCMAKLRAKHAE